MIGSVSQYDDPQHLLHDIETVDGAGSGLDADTLRGHAPEDFSIATHSHPTYIFTQDSPTNTWNIPHNLGKRPSVTVVDSAGTQVMGNVQYITDNEICIRFNGSFSGKAYLN